MHACLGCFQLILVTCWLQSSRGLYSDDQMWLTVPKWKLVDNGDRVFSNATPILMNALPVNLRWSKSVVQFKSGLKLYPFKQSYIKDFISMFYMSVTTSFNQDWYPFWCSLLGHYLMYNSYAVNTNFHSHFLGKILGRKFLENVLYGLSYIWICVGFSPRTSITALLIRWTIFPCSAWTYMSFHLHIEGMAFYFSESYHSKCTQVKA